VWRRKRSGLAVANLSGEVPLGEAYALASLLLFSIHIIVTKVASARMDIQLGFLVSVGVNVGVAVLIVAAQLLVQWRLPAWSAYGFFAFLVAGAFTTYLGRWFFLESVVRFGPTRASLFQTGVPVCTTLIAWLVLGDRLSTLALAGIALTVFGLFVVLYVPGARRPAVSAPEPNRSWLGWIFRSAMLLGAAAALAYATGNVLRGSALRHWDEPLVGGLLGAISGFALHLLFGGRARGLVGALRRADPRGVHLFALTGMANICAQMMMILSLRHIPVAITTLLTSCVPLLVIPMSVVFLRGAERIDGRTVLGTALAVCGVALILLD